MLTRQQLQEMYDADLLGGLAVCASAGYMSQAVVNGADIKALNFVAPWLHNREIAGGIYGEENGNRSDVLKHRSS